MHEVKASAEPMSRSDARYAAKTLLKNGYHHPTIMEDVESGEITVQAYNRCWISRTVICLADLRELISR